MKILFAVITFLSAMSYSQVSLSQSPNAVPDKEIRVDSTVSLSSDPNIEQTFKRAIEEKAMQSYEFYLSIGVLIFGVIVIILELAVLWKRDITNELLGRFIPITIIIVGTFFLITAGYSNNQVAPAMGLLGTIAGYLMGRTQSSSNNKVEK